jgi:hypothetical protein
VACHSDDARGKMVLAANPLAAMLERSARERMLVAEKLAERGVYEAAVYHAAVAVRLRLQAILQLLEPDAPHTCSSLATLARLITRARELKAAQLVEALEGVRERWGKLIACLDNVYRFSPAGCGEPSSMLEQAKTLFSELRKLMDATLSGVGSPSGLTAGEG